MCWPGPNVVSTTLVKKLYFKTYYYIHLIDVLVGNKSLSSHDDQTNINLDHVEYGNMLVDLGTLVTYLPLDIYNRFSPDMIKAVGGETVVDPRAGSYEIICFKDLNLERVPVVTFRLEGGDIKVPGVNMFVEVKKRVSCMTIAPAQDSLGLFGNMIQRNLMVGIDLQKQKQNKKCNSLNFKSCHCLGHIFLSLSQAHTYTRAVVIPASPRSSNQWFCNLEFRVYNNNRRIKSAE
ncbi:hypothetical protein QVD17_28191 [Tagetes erecta]|uniref:Peptidase A1 domain-containing protein n=1 Tax=Tagetes erecta TaxID=13708 RepID=A0AAD8KGB1_TARER|nr:hypothetical protein QVD17_28191 [Tagetes erecta]